ncbi:MAG: dCTP deaminase [Candidatus Saelkia tenebricola]|nr:dCTP deaminase [Candidatus Saelkia tenebricola]
MIKSDKWIKKTALDCKMIDPFQDSQVKTGISYGVSSYGYDFRLSNEFKIFKPAENIILDPKNFPSQAFETVVTDCCIIPANSFVLGKSLEYFCIPRNILTVCFGKSSYARCGVVVNVTPFEPEWEGYATLSISNTSSVSTKIYANEGIAQIIFLESDEDCLISYKDKKGKYQAQKEITLPKV